MIEKNMTGNKSVITNKSSPKQMMKSTKASQKIHGANTSVRDRFSSICFSTNTTKQDDVSTNEQIQCFCSIEMDALLCWTKKNLPHFPVTLSPSEKSNNQPLLNDSSNWVQMLCCTRRTLNCAIVWHQIQSLGLHHQLSLLNH